MAPGISAPQLSGSAKVGRRRRIRKRDAYKIRRVFRKLAKRRGAGSLRQLTVFIRHETVIRLLQFLEYHLE